MAANRRYQGLEKTEEWVDKNLIKVLLLGQNNPMHWYRLWMEWQGSSSEEKDLTAPINVKLDTKWQSAFETRKDHSTGGCIRKRIVYELRKETTPPSIAHVRQHLNTGSSMEPPRTGGLANWRVHWWVVRQLEGWGT